MVQEKAFQQVFVQTIPVAGKARKNCTRGDPCRDTAMHPPAPDAGPPVSIFVCSPEPAPTLNAEPVKVAPVPPFRANHGNDLAANLRPGLFPSALLLLVPIRPKHVHAATGFTRYSAQPARIAAMIPSGSGEDDTAKVCTSGYSACNRFRDPYRFLRYSDRSQ